LNLNLFIKKLLSYFEYCYGYKFDQFIDYHSGLFKSAGVSTKLGISSVTSFKPPVTISFKILCCLGPSCCKISGKRSLILFVSGSPVTIKVLLWIDA